jgi:hypothetical protein
MTDLEKYYYDEVYLVGMDLFDSLSKRQLRRLVNSTGFAIWQLNQSVKNLREEMYQLFGKPLPPTFPKDRRG